MATFVAGGIDTYRASVYGRAHPGTVAYLERSRDRFRNAVSDVGATLLEASDKLYRRYDESKIVRLARAAQRKIDNWYRPNGISVLSEIGHFQHANPDMRRWVMAKKDLRQMYHRQECQGYGDKYIDLEPGRVGRDHYDYRRATDKMWVDEDHEWTVATTWSEDLREGDSDLAFQEKADIALTWEILGLGYLSKGKDDPTDPFNSSL